MKTPRRWRWTTISLLTPTLRRSRVTRKPEALASLKFREDYQLKSFACGEIVPGCEARWVCSTEEEVLFAVAEHAASVHGLAHLSPALNDAVRAAIVVG